jgi:hypothetical protein
MSMLTRLAALALAAAATTAIGGCVVDDIDEPSVATVDQKMITWNSLEWNAITWNTLTTSAFAVTVLTDMPLSSDVYSYLGTGSQEIVLREHATPPEARTFMKYLVGCALPKGSKVQWDDVTNSVSETYDGQLGLCPDWEFARPDKECRRRVSACLLARNNGLGETVRISLRGQDHTGGALPLDPASYAFTDAPNPGELCAPGDPGCGFLEAPVGRCNPGDLVKVESADRIRMRACANDKVCGWWESLDEEVNGVPVEFTCPHTGVYNVMIGEWGWPPSTWDLHSSAGLLPENEAAVYRWREGAFYGDIFDPRALGVETKLEVRGQEFRVDYLVDGKQFDHPSKIPADFRYTVYRNMFSCSSENWNDGDARAQYRVCASIGSEHCAARYAGNCSPWPASEPLPDPRYTYTGRCKIDDEAPVPGDGDYNRCEDLDGRVHKIVLTTNLKDKCDAVPPERRKQCKKG